MKQWCAVLLLFISLVGRAAEVIPAKPALYFNDYAHVVSAATASQLNETLAEFERQSSDQILVAVFPRMQSDSSIEDYTVRVARSWDVGQKGKNNGAVLFVFVENRKAYIQVGYGLEGALPDVIAKRIIENELTPRFRNGDYDGGLRAGVAAIIAAVKGEVQREWLHGRRKGQDKRIQSILARRTLYRSFWDHRKIIWPVPSPARLLGWCWHRRLDD